MSKLETLSLAMVQDIGGQLRDAAAAEGTVQAAAQAAVTRLHGALDGEVPLIRIFGALRQDQVPERDRAVSRQLAGSKERLDQLADDTVVLSLLGTCGLEPDWNDRHCSAGHLCIPLLDAEFVSSIPMIANLMSDMGVGLDWLDARDNSIVLKKIGTGVGLFYVEDAPVSVDSLGRKIVPASDFVDAHGIRTVFGLGGCFLDGTFVVLLLFTREHLRREDVLQCMPWLSLLKEGFLPTFGRQAWFP